MLHRLLPLYKAPVLQCPTMQSPTTMPKGKKFIIAVRVDEERMVKLWQLSERTMVTTAVLVRHGIELVLKEYEQKKRFEPKQAEAPG